MITIGLSKQQAFCVDPKTIQQKHNFTGNLDRGAGATISFIIEEVKETILQILMVVCI